MKLKFGDIVENNGMHVDQNVLPFLQRVMKYETEPAEFSGPRKGYIWFRESFFKSELIKVLTE